MQRNLFNEKSWPQIVKLKNDFIEIIDGQEPIVCLSALLWTVSEILNDVAKDQKDFEHSTANCVRALQECAIELFIYKRRQQKVGGQLAALRRSVEAERGGFPDEKIPKDMLELAHIVETKSRHFSPEEFEDHYEDALKELLKKKQAGEKIEAPRERAPAKVINLIDALRRKVEAERGGSAKPQAPPVKVRSSQSERPKKKKSR